MNESFRDYKDFDQTVFTRTPEGYLTGKIRVTGAGVFSYRTAEGLKRRLRPVTEVSAQDSISTLNCKPVTLLHPMEDVSRRTRRSSRSDSPPTMQAGTG